MPLPAPAPPPPPPFPRAPAPSVLPCTRVLSRLRRSRVCSTVNEFLPLINSELVMAMRKNVAADGTPIGSRKRRVSSAWSSGPDVDLERWGARTESQPHVLRVVSSAR